MTARLIAHTVPVSHDASSTAHAARMPRVRSGFDSGDLDMRVYVVRWFSAESYTDDEGVHKIFDSREKAEKYLEETGTGPHEVDDENFDYGYFLSKAIEEYDVS